MTSAVLYMRCSGVGQIEGDTWERQTLACNKYAATHEIQIVEIYRDEGVSGKTELECRAGLAACLERVENNGVKLVIVESADRLARDSMIAEVIIRQFQKAGVRVIAASGGVDLTAGDDSNPTAKLIRQILAAVAEFDRCVTVLKLRAARERKKAKNGSCEGRKPFGVLPEEMATRDLILNMHDMGHGPARIALQLNHESIPSKYGKRWHPATISKILRRSA